MKEKPNILFMVQLPPPVHGAALRNKSLLESSKLNEDFSLIAAPLYFANEVRNIGKFSFRKIYLTFTYCANLIRILKKNRVDLAYFTLSPFGWAFYRDMLIVSILKMFHVKRLYHLRIKGIKKTTQSGIGKGLVNYAFKNASVICLSKNHVEDLIGTEPKKIFVIPNGIRVESLKAENDQGWISNSCKILFLSNLSRKKGVFDLLEALVNLRAEHIPFDVQIVGADHDLSRKDLEDFISKNGLSGSVIVPGPVYGDDKFKLLAACDIFVFPTRFELFPGVVLEAMQLGKAIVTTMEGSIPEIIDDGANGVLVQKEDVIELTAAINNLIADQQKRECLGRNAREKFFSSFTLDRFELNMSKVFAELINEQ
jgi:glycosyltransferase involved in cell wall biosynthesis